MTNPTPHRATPESTQRLLNKAGRIADLALSLVGGRGLNCEIPPAHPDQFSDIAKELRRAVESYNDTIITYSRHA